MPTSARSSDRVAPLEQLGPADLLERYAALRRAVSNEKHEVRAHKERLRQAAESLAQLEEYCRRSGIRLIVVPDNPRQA